MKKLIIILISFVTFQQSYANEKAMKFACDFLNKIQVSRMQKAPSATNSVQLTYESADTVSNKLAVYKALNKGFIILAPTGNEFQVIG